MVHPRPARYLTRLADRLRPYNVAETLLPARPNLSQIKDRRETTCPMCGAAGLRNSS